MTRKQQPKYPEILNKIQDNTDQQFDYHTLDKHNLDSEWVKQIQVVDEKGRELATARRDLRVAETKSKVMVAELKRKVRHSPEIYGLEKVTEGALDECITTDPACQHMTKEINELEYKVNLLQVAMQTLENRKKAIPDMVTLFMADYFSSPRLHRQDQANINEIQTRSGLRRASEKLNARTDDND